MTWGPLGAGGEPGPPHGTLPPLWPVASQGVCAWDPEGSLRPGAFCQPQDSDALAGKAGGPPGPASRPQTPPPSTPAPAGLTQIARCPSGNVGTVQVITHRTCKSQTPSHGEVTEDAPPGAASLGVEGGGSPVNGSGKRRKPSGRVVSYCKQAGFCREHSGPRGGAGLSPTGGRHAFV